jgi:hypothetical protein
MAQIQTTATKKTKPSSNVYTVLVLVAFVALLAAVSVVWWKNVTLTGDEQPPESMKNPFYLSPLPAS